MRLEGGGVAPELFALPAGIAPSVLPGFGTPALVPGIDSPSVVPLVEEPVVGAAAEVPAADPLPDVPDELLCANANVLDTASDVAKAKVQSFIAVTHVLLLINDKPRKEFKFRNRCAGVRALKQKRLPVHRELRRASNGLCSVQRWPFLGGERPAFAIPEPAHLFRLRPASASASRAGICVVAELNFVDPIWSVVWRQSLSFDINNETKVMKITTIVMATVLAISSSCAFAAGGGGAGGAAGAAGGASAGAGAGAASTTGTATGSSTGTTTTPGQTPTTPGLNANGPCNGASSRLVATLANPL